MPSLPHAHAHHLVLRVPLLPITFGSRVLSEILSPVVMTLRRQERSALDEVHMDVWLEGGCVPCAHAMHLMAAPPPLVSKDWKIRINSKRPGTKYTRFGEAWHITAQSITPY
ncbi:MAG: hypothetical protein J3Q66DRAFT_363632 [Benniella sp.]|nr:MAG: hypothetical protein J3Q66DRAFT_363632 [Benniella sp.]